MTSETKAVEAEPAVRDLDEFTKKEEKRLLRKLDFFILTYSCFSYFFNYLDRSAFANAYVAGLKEDLNLVGNQYSILLSLTTAGLVIGQIPNALIIQKIPPRIWLPSMVILWGCLTICGAACKNYAQFAAVRFLMGLAEASCYAGCVYILGSWYKPAELAKRTALFTIAGQVGTMFAGAMMAAIHRSMDGHGGLKGWQWVFIIDGVITCPIAIMGYLYFPDTPEKTKASYLSPRERDLALSRVPPKRSDSHSLDPFPLMKRIFAGPEIYCLTAFSVLAAALQAFPFQSLFLLYLKHYQDKPFTQTNINTYPIAVQAVGIVSEILTSWYLDKTGHRTRTGLVICSVQIVCAAILLVPNAPHAAAFFAFYTSGSSYAITPLLYGWGNIICIRAGDDAQRAVIIATMVTGGQLLWTWWGIVLYPATDAPYWKKGSIAMICGSVVLGGYLFVVRWLDRRSIAKMPLAVGTEAETSSPDERAATTEDKTSTRV